MKYNHLRAYIKRMCPATAYTLKNCKVVIDGRCFFKDTYNYKRSGCQSILGGEYDRYAAYLKNILKTFIESHVTCYVIFNGAMDVDLEKRQAIHQRIVTKTDSIDPDDKDVYCDPIFVKDVWKEVLDELGIKHFTTEYDSDSAIIWVANFFKCPVITNNYERSLRYVSCISPKSLAFDSETGSINCTIFDAATCRKTLSIKHELLPLLFTLADEKSIYFKRLQDIMPKLNLKNLMGALFTWTRWQRSCLETTIKNITETLTEKQGQAFLKAYDDNSSLCNPVPQRVVSHFFAGRTRSKHFDWFERAVSNGQIAVPYINLRNKGIFSGSWVIFDKNQDDAMLPALDIIFYVYQLLTKKENLKITFIGRKSVQSWIWEVEKDLSPQFHTEAIFQDMISDMLPGFNMKILDSAPEDSWMLIIALVYFCQRKNDVSLAYSVILSYVMLRLVSDKVGVIKRTYFMDNNVEEMENKENQLPQKECVTAVDALMDFFYVKKIKRKFDRSILQLLAEFQHCLQHMNYLNKLCGVEMKCTVYHKCLNATFVYNMYCKLKDKDHPSKYLEKRLKNSSVFDCYTQIESVFEGCLMSTGVGLVLNN